LTQPKKTQLIKIDKPDYSLRKQFDESSEKMLKRFENNSRDAEIFITDAIKFLAASDRAGNQLENKSRFKKFVSFFTGGNSNLRDASLKNIRESQRATLKMLEKMADQNIMLMDAVNMNRSAIMYLEYQNVELKRYLVQMFTAYAKRFEKIEHQILLHRFQINTHELELRLSRWAYRVAYGDIGEPRTVSLLTQLSMEYFIFLTSTINELQQGDPENLYTWPTSTYDYFGQALREAGFRDLTDHATRPLKISIDEFVLQFISEIVDSRTFLEQLNTDVQLIRYPIGYVQGSNLLMVLIWEIMNHPKEEDLNKLSRSVVSKLTDYYGIDCSQEVDWVDLGYELLYGMKLYSDQAFIQNVMLEILKDVLEEQITEDPEIFGWENINDRIEYLSDIEKPMDRLISTGYRVNLIQTPLKSIQLYSVFNEEKNQDQSIEIKFAFSGFEKGKNTMIPFLTKNLKMKLLCESENTFEIGENIIPAWNTWDNTRNTLAAKLNDGVKILKEGSIPGLVK
jgi:hypothetical protein